MVLILASGVHRHFLLYGQRVVVLVVFFLEVMSATTMVEVVVLVEVDHFVQVMTRQLGG
jgi:hypothetical protein